MKVAVRFDESPPAPLERAEVVVDGPGELIGLVRRLQVDAPR